MGPDRTDDPSEHTDPEELRNTVVDTTAPTDETADSSRSQTTDDHTQGLPAKPVDVAAHTPGSEPRTYIEIRPTDSSLSPEAVTQAMTRLHAVLEEATRTRLRDRLTGSTTRPSVEWLLVVDGRADTSIRYLAGVTDSDLVDDLESVLRTCLPHGYECTRVAFHPCDVLDHETTIPVTDVYTDAGPTIDTATTPPLQGVRFHGEADLPGDWHLPLRNPSVETDHSDTDYRENNHQYQPLAAVVDLLQQLRRPAVYQVLARPYQDITASADEYCHALESGTATLPGKFWQTVTMSASEDTHEHTPLRRDRDRIEAIQERETRRTFSVTARAVVSSRETNNSVEPSLNQLAATFDPLGGQHHRIDGTVEIDDPDTGNEAGTEIYEALRDREHEPVSYTRFRNRLTRRFTSPGLVVTPRELPALCLVDGSALTTDSQRAIGVREPERTGIPLPPPERLRRYRPPGMALVRPLTSDRDPLDQPFVLPPEYQSRHQVVVGNTGAGKSVLLAGAMLSNTHATEGPAILFDYKGGATAREYLQTHYRAQGSFENVLYFDLTNVLPALSFFDIGPLLEAGLSREEARSRKTGHYEEILRGIMPAGQYDEATESPTVIRNHLRALYDPVHGSDTFPHSKFYEALQRTQGNQSPPPVSEDTFETYFAGLLERDSKVFTKVMGGAISRVESIATDARLAPLFNHVPGDSDARFDFRDLVDQDAVVVFDFGGMEPRVKRTLTLVLLSQLWTALKARREAADPGADLAQVNLYLEEAKDVAETALVDTLLAQGRSFGLSLTLGVQFLQQLDSPDPANNTYLEALNETATFVVGNVAVDRYLPEVLATGDMPPSEVERRLGALGRGEWLVRPGAGFGEDPVQPFLGESLPAPPGHPASDDPLTGVASEGFERAFDRLEQHTNTVAGLELTEPNRTEQAHAESVETSEETDARRIDSLLPYTLRMPECVGYDEPSHTLRCRHCETRFNASIQGMVRAIECCQSLDDIDTDDIPICDVNLKLSPEEVADSEFTVQQLYFMQVVYNVQQLEYDPPEFDLVTDSMMRIREYTGVDADAVDELIDEGLVRHDTDHPHRLYSLRPDGRAVIEEAHQHGVAYGHGEGDLDESTEHVLGVLVAVRWLRKAYAEDPDSEVVTVQPYHDLHEGSIDAGGFFGDDEDVAEATDDYERHRLDVVGLDAHGDIVVTMEVERINHDTRRAVPADYDKMAACDPQEAIWMAMSHTDAHEILHALNDPLEGDSRVEKTYAETSPANAFRIDRPGFTDMYTLEQLRDQVLNWDDPDQRET